MFYIATLYAKLTALRRVAIGATTILLAGIGTFALPSLAAATTPATVIAAGGDHTCAALVTGAVKCWGDNTFGQLGGGVSGPRGIAPGQMGDALPQLFFNGTGPVVQLALGVGHSCARTAVGDVFCFGNNASGQVGGGGGTTNRAVTVRIRKIATGANHTCVLAFTGVVNCWGNNAFGQLGRGNTVNSSDPFVSVSLGTGRTAIDIAASATSTCALLDNSAVKCWGDNTFGQLGLGDTAPRGVVAGQMGDALPAVSTGLAGIHQLTGGANHFCAVSNVGQIKCWGLNDQGQLGQGDNNNRGDQPGEVSSQPSLPAGHAFLVWSATAGAGHTCAGWRTGFVTAPGGMKCWGANGFGQLGLGDLVNRGDAASGAVTVLSPPNVDVGHNTIPNKTSLPRLVLSFAAGDNHTCAIVQDGAVKCWGRNNNGQLGLGDTVDRGGDPSHMGDDLPELDL